MKATRFLLSAALLVVMTSPLLAQEVINVMVGDAVVARIRCPGTAPTLLERARLIDGRITDIISYEQCAHPNVYIKEQERVPTIYVGSYLLMRVYPADAAPNECTPLALAKLWKANLLKWLPRAASPASRPNKAAAAQDAALTDPLIGDAGRVGLPPGAYTGLIVDASGLGAKRSIAPKIVGPEGKEVWGTVKCSASWAVCYGIAAWAHALKQAKTSVRAGTNPLVIPAQQVLGPYSSTFRISVEDIARVRKADAVSHFLKNCNVVFVQ